MITEFRGKYRFLSNFFPCPVEYEGIVYPTAENAFQAAKTLDPDLRAAFAICSPQVAKKKGQELEIRPLWNEMRVEIMTDILRYKFSNNELMRELLLATGDEILIEGNTWGDRFWGMAIVNGRYTGENWLGKSLMRVRRELRS